MSDQDTSLLRALWEVVNAAAHALDYVGTRPPYEEGTVPPWPYLRPRDTVDWDMFSGSVMIFDRALARLRALEAAQGRPACLDCPEEYCRFGGNRCEVNARNFFVEKIAHALVEAKLAAQPPLAPQLRRDVTIPMFDWTHRDRPVIGTRTVAMGAFCPECGGVRGETKRYRTGVWDYDGWTNPCGHLDEYIAVLEEAELLARRY